jgi:hypothetical protein
MKRGTLRLLPLQADLCLNKQKVDIEDFKGWNKNNAPVYGNCLSPLYKKEDTHHDFFIGDDYYDWANGVLSKNGVAVLSGQGSKKIKKTRINDDYSAIAISDDTLLTWLKEHSATDISFSLHGSATQTATLSNCQRIVATKAFANDTYELYGIVVMFLRTDGAYGYYIAWNDEGTSYTSYGSGSPTRWVGFNVISPLIQVGVFTDHVFMVSFFGSSGANLPSTEVKNVYVQSGSVYDNPTFKDVSLYPTRYLVGDGDSGVSVRIRTTCAAGSLYKNPTSMNKVNFGMRQRIQISVKAHSLPVEVTILSKDPSNGRDLETFRFEANTEDVTYVRDIWYWDYLNASGHYSNNARYRYQLSIYTGTQYLVEYNTYGNGLVQKYEGDYSKNTTLKLLPAYLRNTYNYTGYPPTENGDTNICCRLKYWTVSNVDNFEQPIYTTKEAEFGGYGKNGLTVENYRNEDGETESNNTFWSDSDAIDYLNINVGGSVNIVEYGTNPGYKYNFIYGTGLYYDDGSGIVAINPTWYDKNTYAAYNGPSPARYNFSYETSQYVYWTFKYKTETVITSLKEVDCCMDDGNLYCTGPISNNENVALPLKLFALSGVFGAFNTTTKEISYTSTSVFNISYDDDESTNVFPKYFKGLNISLGNNYLRITYLFKAKQNDTNYINILIDSLLISEGEKAAHLYSGIQSTTGGNMQGGIKNTADNTGFRLLFNNNLVSNIACYENKKYIGTILADWFTIDDTFCPAMNASVCYYKDNNNRIWKIELTQGETEWEYRLIENRYVVLNTTNYFNCYDTKTGIKRHWASDYNNRMLFGYAFNEYTNDSTFRSLLTMALFSGLMITAQNANYEETKDTITGLELGAILYSRVLKEYISFIACGVPYGAVEGIDLYRGDANSTAAMYICSYQNGIKYIDNDLVNPYAVYPISQNGDVRYNPNLFTRFISSYNNKDMVISDGVAYKLVYFNNVTPIMAYYLLDGVEELLDAFVLQSSYYGVSETRLYQMNYSNGVGVEVVCDITNLEYLGALPTQALFWSAQNRAIYSFKGNCIMSLSQYANDLEEIKGKWYNPATQELFLDTNIGLLVFSDLGTYCLPKFVVEVPPEEEGDDPTYEERDIKDIFFYPDMFIINLKDDTSHSYYWSYNPLQGYDSNGIHFVTKYYGNARTPITVNNIWIRLYNQDIADAEGEIRFKGHTVTDIGFQTDEKTVEIGGEDGEQWDAETNTMLVKYTPQFNRGLGFSLEVNTTFPIIDIKYDYVEEGSIDGQIAHINI